MANAHRGVAPFGHNPDKSSDRQEAENIIRRNQEQGGQRKIEDRGDLNLTDVERRPGRSRREEPPGRDKSHGPDCAVGYACRCEETLQMHF